MSNKKISFSSKRYVEIIDGLSYYRTNDNPYFRKNGPSFVGGYEVWYKKDAYTRKDGPTAIDEKANKLYWYFGQINDPKTYLNNEEVYWNH